MTYDGDNALVIRVAEAIARALGDDYTAAFLTKAEWVKDRGYKGGRYRDINMPLRSEYEEAARAAIAECVR